MWEVTMTVPRARSTNITTEKLNLILSIASAGFDAIVYIRIVREHTSANEPEH
jgi:hypothetical protein